jgi:carboxylesterase
MSALGDEPEEAVAPAPVTEPFFWTAGDVGCLLIHGFTGTPYEMRFLGERLHAAGYSVGGIRLAGHATRVEDLAQCRWTDWYRSVEDGFEQLSRHCSRIIAIGLSMGALLTVRLAVDRASQISGLVLLSPSFELANPWAERLGGIARLALPILPEPLRYLTKGDSDIADPIERKQRPTYRRIPLRGVAELVDLQRRARAWLPSVAQPVLAIHARQDHTAPLSNLDLLKAAIGELRRTVVLEESYHVITVDRERERVAAEVSRFLGDTLGSSRGEGEGG